MADRWDNIEIVQAIDRRQQETYRGGPMRGVNGLHLMEQITGVMVHEPQLVRGFVQELHIARDLGLLTFKVQADPAAQPGRRGPELVPADRLGLRPDRRGPGPGPRPDGRPAAPRSG